MPSAGDSIPRPIAARLRNDGGWDDARAYRGTWTADADGATITLRSRATDRIADGGPLLEDQTASTLVLRVAPDGTATLQGRSLRHVAPADVPALRAQWATPAQPLLDATRPGRTYRGTVTAVGHAASEPLLLEFTEQDADGSVIAARLSSPTKPSWTRPFRGTLVFNRYRTANAPIRLQSVDRDRATAADPRLPLGFNTYGPGLVIALRPQGSDLVGEDSRFTYRFHLAE